MIQRATKRSYSLSYHFDPSGERIRPGEKVSAKLADAHGFDENGEPVAGSPNPLAGPFLVEGAHPGEALAVSLHHLRPNRSLGWASKSLHPNLRLTPEEVAAHQKEYIEWEIDLDRSTARPPKSFFPDWDVELPIHTVLGCLGVAPNEVDAIPSIDCGPYGGNMDYPRITAGAKIYLPVFVEGACLYLGDGHAIQGAGEITGNGIEVSCDVTFSVEIIHMNPPHPRGEDAGSLFSIANALPLELAYKLATNDMMAWLNEGYGLNKDQIGMLLGQCVRYENGNLVSNAYTVSCLMPKIWPVE